MNVLKVIRFASSQSILNYLPVTCSTFGQKYRKIGER